MSKKEYVNIALPKGRLGNKVYSKFTEAGFTEEGVSNDDRRLIFTNEKQCIKFFWVKPSDVTVYVERGAADIGVCGKDIVEEYQPEIYELMDLKIGKCKVCVAAKEDFRDDRSKTLRVATKYPGIAEEYYKRVGRDIDIISLNGSIELAPLLGLSDVIVDIVETGKTLKENDLRVILDIMDVSARVIVNKASYKFKKNKVDKIINALEGIK